MVSITCGWPVVPGGASLGRRLADMVCMKIPRLQGCVHPGSPNASVPSLWCERLKRSILILQDFPPGAQGSRSVSVPSKV